MKKLVIINGITGAIGSAILAEYAHQQNACVYGISRKAYPLEGFLDVDGFLSDKTLICSIGEMNKESIERFVSVIDFKKFDSVIYIHALGYYPFEVVSDGTISVTDDNDNDGINDLCMKLTFTFFSEFTTQIRNYYGKFCTALLFGGIADKYQPGAHTSWWTVMNKTKEWMKNNPHVAAFRLLNISSVICPHEIITRPFVFTQTDANSRYWLKPYDVAKGVMEFLEKNKHNKWFIEEDLFNKLPEFDESYYDDKNFTQRKVAELYEK